MATRPRKSAARRLAHVLPAVVAVVVSMALPLLASNGPVQFSAADMQNVAAQTGATAGSNGPANFPMDGPAAATARNVATQVWGTNACGGQVQMTWTTQPANTNAMARWKNPTGEASNWGANFDCRIEFNDQAQYDFVKFCTVMAHEIGHLVGREHEQDGTLMGPNYTGPIQQCIDADPTPAPAVPDTAIEDDAFTDDDASPSAGAGARASTKKAAKKRCTTTYRAGKRVTKCTTAKAAVKKRCKMVRMSEFTRIKRCSPAKAAKRSSRASTRR